MQAGASLENILDWAGTLSGFIPARGGNPTVYKIPVTDPYPVTFRQTRLVTGLLRIGLPIDPGKILFRRI